ncbi:MAG: hypothetical protein AAF236_10265, partial [Verrucomicrobiota bacterium]
FRNAFDWLVPTLGPQIPANPAKQWQDPPGNAANASGGFDLDIPVEGRLYTLHRLDRPDTVTVGYRSEGFAFFWEALLFMLTLVAGLLLITQRVRIKLIYFTVAGLLPLVIAGAVTPSASSFWLAIYLGTIFAAIIWVLKGLPALLAKIVRKLKELFKRRPRAKKKKKPKKDHQKDATEPSPEPDTSVANEPPTTKE